MLYTVLEAARKLKTSSGSIRRIVRDHNIEPTYAKGATKANASKTAGSGRKAHYTEDDLKQIDKLVPRQKQEG